MKDIWTYIDAEFPKWIRFLSISKTIMILRIILENPEMSTYSDLKIGITLQLTFCEKSLCGNYFVSSSSYNSHPHIDPAVKRPSWQVMKMDYHGDKDFRSHQVVCELWNL